jgi:ABC-type uncharacterized transport system involved in gliding motility auxiliary subunit
VPTFIKFLWLAGFFGLVYIVYSFEYANNITELKNADKVSATINSVECKDGSRSFMKKKLKIISNQASFEFTRNGECSELIAFYKKAREFEAVQVKSVLSFHAFSLKVDGVEQLDFKEQLRNYNLYIILSPFLVPLLLAVGATVNWRRGRWRGKLT